MRFYASTPVRATDGTVVGSLCTWDTKARALSDERVLRLEDLAEQVATLLELRQVASELGHAASHDPLTGILNRTMLDDRRLQAAVRAEDTVARLGGDEFVVVAELQPGTGGERIVIDRIESALAEPAEYAGALRPLAASVGAALAEAGDDVRAALFRAGQAIAPRKRSSR